MAERYTGNSVSKNGNKGRIHFVGIGGIGLSAIAKVLLEEGYPVSGSDLRLSPLTEGLVAKGAVIHRGHAADNVVGAHLVVVSSAIPPDNPEVVAARRRGQSVMKRAEILGRMMAGRYGIAVAGTHGKTTTTAMIAFILVEAGYDPSFIVGGVVQNLGTNARAGQGPHFIVEADEYDRTFLGLSPRIAVVTNIEMDHPDCYQDLADMTEAFRKFLALVPDEGCIVGCEDATRVGELLKEIKETRESKVITYGLGENADWRATDIRVRAVGGSHFAVWHEGQPLGDFSLQVPGLHNVLNALAAVAATSEAGVNLKGIKEALRRFQGTQRRFEHKGTAGGVVIIDDYAHHPTEIRATLAAARGRYPHQAIWAVFQPHTYSRTKALLDEFARSFGDADHVIVIEIYAAREYDDLGVSGEDIVRAMGRHPDARYIASLDEVADYLLRHLRPGDVLITLGAGDGYIIGEKVLATLKDKEARKWKE